MCFKMCYIRMQCRLNIKEAPIYLSKFQNRFCSSLSFLHSLNGSRYSQEEMVIKEASQYINVLFRKVLLFFWHIRQLSVYCLVNMLRQGQILTTLAKTLDLM